MDDEQYQELPARGLSKEQKIGFCLLLIFGIMSVGLGYVQLRNTLYAPFALNDKVTAPLRDQINTVDALRYRDTDNDGLSDFDEQYIYHTSAYLYDTFGYGMSDKEVIAKGLALCPRAGKDCSTDTAVSADAAGTTSSFSNLIPALPSTSTLTAPPVQTGSTLGINQIIQDPAQLRQMFLQAGMDPAALKKISDTDLVAMVNQMVNSTSSMQALTALSGAVSSSLKAAR